MKNRFYKFMSSLSLIIALGLFVPWSPNQAPLALIGGAKATGGGPIVLDGMDPVCHSGYESTGLYIARVLKKVHNGSTNLSNGHIAVLGSNGGTNSCGATWASKLPQYLGEFTTAPTVDFYTTTAGINGFFDSINTSTPAMIWIPDNWSRSSATESIFTTNAEKIADFVNSGGGLFANNGTYGWLTALLPSAVYNNGGCNGGPEATTDGVSDFNLNNTIVAACWHGYFTGNVGTLKSLVDYPYPTPSSTRKAVSIGGGSVSLPSSFTLGITPTNPEAGQDLTITATAQTIAGVPQSGVSVTVTVSSGPDAGQTFTAITNSAGIATITIRTNSVGSAVYTATATVNGVAKTVSATVNWLVPVTTTTITTTTTTLAPTTTTTLAPTTTQITPTTEQTTITQPSVVITTTTIHDHSTHNHGPLPNTGSDFMPKMFLAIIILLIGAFFYSLSKLEGNE